MKLIRLVVLFVFSILCGMVIAGPAAAVKHKCTGPCPDAAKSASSNAVSPDAELGARVVAYDDKDVVMISAVSGAPRFVSAKVAEDYRRQIEIANEETRKAKKDTQSAIDSGVSKFITNVRFPYRFEAGKKPFFVRAMYHDDKFTY